MPAIIDLIGRRFDRLVVVKRADSKRWECLCDCGTVKAVLGSALRRGETKSCGCLRKDKGRSRIVDLTGLCVGKLTVIERDESIARLGVWWICRCGFRARWS